MAAPPRGPAELGPPDRDDPHWRVGDRRDGWLKVSDGGFVHGGRWTWRAVRVWLHVVRFALLGRRPVLGPPLPLVPGVPPAAEMPAADKRQAMLTGTPVVGQRHDLHWEPVAGTRGRLLRLVPPASLGVAALTAYAGLRGLRGLRGLWGLRGPHHLHRPHRLHPLRRGRPGRLRMAPGRSGRLAT